MEHRSKLNLPVIATPDQTLAEHHNIPEARSFTQNQNRLEAEDEDISKAIEMSLDDELDRRQSGSPKVIKGNRENAHSPTIQEAFIHNIDDLILRLSNDFTPLNDSRADTLVYIGPPPRLPGQSVTEYQYVKNHFEKVLKMSSSKLKSVGSQQFDKFLGPMSVRTEKRLRKQGVLVRAETQAANDFKYFVDLQPPSEDVDAVILLTDLTCTQGILHWHFARKHYGIPRSLVAGTDSFNVNKIAISADDRQEQNLIPVGQPQKQLAGTRREGARSSIESEEPHIQPSPEYCPVRHRSGIERILQAIQGNDPKLDSAPKMWTFYALAKYFNCAKHERINKWISSWIYANKNSNFIQCNPEVVHQIGMGIESFDMVRDAFSILVGETALLHVYGEADPSVLSPLVRSVHGRRLEHILDEDERNRVDHAASSLVRRMRAYFVPIFRDLNWLDGSIEYRKLRDLVPDTPEELATIKEAKRHIHDFVRGKMYWVMCQLIGQPFIDHEPRISETEVFRPGSKMCFHETYNRFNQPMRLFTRTLWIALSKIDFTWGRSNISHEGTPGLIGLTHLAQAMLDEYAGDPFNGIKETIYFTLKDEIVKVNSIMQERHEREVNQRNHQEHAIDATVTQNVFNDDDLQFHNLGVTPNQMAANHRVQGSSGSLDAVTVDQLGLQSPKRTSEDFAPSDTASDKRQKTEVDEHSGISLPFRARNVEWTPISQQASQDRKVSDGRQLNDQVYSELATIDITPQTSTSKFPFEGRTGYTVNQRGLASRPSPELHPLLPSTELSPQDDAANLKGLLFGADDGGTHDHGNASSIQNLATTPSKQGVRFALRPKIGFGADASHKSPSSTMEQANTSVKHETDDLYSNDDLQFDMTIDGQESQPAHIQTTTDTPEVIHRGQSTLAEQVDQINTVQDEDWWLSNLADTSTTSHAPKRNCPNLFSSAQIIRPPLPPPPTIYLDRMLSEAASALYKICDPIIDPPHLFHGVDRVPTDLIDTLTCLEDNEWKYLPLWAGGLDDGTGGVFDEADVPNLEAGGFRGGKRGIGRVKIIDSSDTAAAGGSELEFGSESSSSFDDIASEAVSTVGRASKQATDGTQTVQSLSDTSSEADEFMRQDEIYEQIQAMKMDQLGSKGKGKGKAKLPEYGAGADTDVPAFDDNEDMDLPEDKDADDDGVSTIMGGRSDDDDNDNDNNIDIDIQGEMFHDIDDDDDDTNDKSKSTRTFEDDVKDDSDSDLEIIDKKDFQ